MSGVRFLLCAVAAGIATLAVQSAVSPGVSQAAAPLCFGKPATIVGTAGSDSLTGTDGPDVIVGRGGNDRIYGRRGADRICSDSGSDRAYGGSGNDQMTGGSGNDIVRGDYGADVLIGASGHDDLDGGSGADVNRGGDGRDVCRSPAGSGCEPYCRANQRYVGTRIAERRVNSIEAQQSTPVCFAESDFMFTKDGHLVATHDAAMGGTCGNVGEQTLARLRLCRLANNARVSSLANFLGTPLTEWYIDLKANQLATSDAEILHTVEAAVNVIKASGRANGAVLMLYKVTPEAADLIRQNGVRAGRKGYPSTRKAAESLVQNAADNGFEMACIRITNIDKAMLDFSNSLGIWHLAWELGETTPTQWGQLTDVGLTGLLTTRSKIPAARRAIFGT